MHICLNRATAGAGLPFEAFVKLAADAGFHGCDVDMGWGVMHGAEALLALLSSHKQRPGGWAPSFDWRGDEPALRAGLTQFEKEANIATELKIDTCATWILPSSERRFLENWCFHVERLKPLATILGERGLRLGLEFVAPMHLRRAFAHEFIFTPGQMLELAADVGDNVGLLVDSFHCYCAGTTSEYVAHLPAEKIVLVHINDCPPGPLAEVQDFRRLLPGAGAIDLASFIQALRTAGYDGPLSLEVFNDDLKQMPSLEAAKKARNAAAPLLCR